MKTKNFETGLLIALAGVLLFAGCTSNNNGGTNQADTLSVAGSTTVQPIAAKAADGIAVIVNPSNTLTDLTKAQTEKHVTRAFAFAAVLLSMILVLNYITRTLNARLTAGIRR